MAVTCEWAHRGQALEVTKDNKDSKDKIKKIKKLSGRGCCSSYLSLSLSLIFCHKPSHKITL